MTPIVKPPSDVAASPGGADHPPETKPALPAEIGGREGLDPTRYGDWEIRGRCIDF